MQSPSNQPWQFSLRALLAFTTAFAVCAAIAVHYPRLGFAIGFVVASAAAIYTADRLAAATPTPAVRRTWRWILVCTWFAAGAVMLGLASTTSSLYGNPGPQRLAARLTIGLFASAAIYCIFRGRRAMR